MSKIDRASCKGKLHVEILAWIADRDFEISSAYKVEDCKHVKNPELDDWMHWLSLQRQLLGNSFRKVFVFTFKLVYCKVY